MGSQLMLGNNKVEMQTEYICKSTYIDMKTELWYIYETFIVIPQCIM